MPLLVLVLLGAVLLGRRRVLGWSLLLSGCAGFWLAHTAAAGHYLQQWALGPPPVLQPAQVAALRGAPATAVLVLGGGRSPWREEYGSGDLHPRSVERLRYGAHLVRQTRLPLGYSGGVGWGASVGASEAELAARIVEQELGLKLRWQEALSRDTRENAERSVPMLRDAGIRHIVLVTHAYHMPRATRAFEAAIARSGVAMQLTPAPMGVAASGPLRAVDWMPTMSGAEHTRLVLHEWLGRLAGA